MTEETSQGKPPPPQALGGAENSIISDIAPVDAGSTSVAASFGAVTVTGLSEVPANDWVREAGVPFRKRLREVVAGFIANQFDPEVRTEDLLLDRGPDHEVPLAETNWDYFQRHPFDGRDPNEYPLLQEEALREAQEEGRAL